MTASKETTPEFPYRVRIDGEDWVVREHADRPGQYSFDWISGPHVGYGFSSSSSGGHALTEGELDESIRDFLADIDPATGFLD